jgi:hypothetical protein
MERFHASHLKSTVHRDNGGANGKPGIGIAEVSSARGHAVDDRIAREGE